MFKLIIFGDRALNEPNSCYRVGIMGCNKIQECHMGTVDGMDTFGYRVSFDDGSQIEVTDTIYVSD